MTFLPPPFVARFSGDRSGFSFGSLSGVYRGLHPPPLSKITQTKEEKCHKKHSSSPCNEFHLGLNALFGHLNDVLIANTHDFALLVWDVSITCIHVLGDWL